MIDETNQDELIDQYLQGELSGESLSQFEAKISSDDQLKKEVALQKAIIKNVKAAGRRGWAEKLGRMHEQLSVPGAKETTVAPVVKLSWKKYLLAAASVLLVIVSAVFVFKKKNGGDANEVFLAYYQPFPDVQQTTRSKPGSVSEKDAAFKAYNGGNYGESIRLFKIITEKQADELSLFYLGNAYLANDQPAEAEQTFKKYLEAFTEFKSEAEWYLSLSYLKQNKEKEAHAVLEKIAGANNDFSARAKEILNK